MCRSSAICSTPRGRRTCATRRASRLFLALLTLALVALAALSGWLLYLLFAARFR